MSEANVDAVRRMYEAFNRGDLGDATEMLHPDPELHQPPEVPDADSYYGRDEFVRGFGLWLSEFDASHFEPEEIIEAGDYVIMRVRVSGTGKASGIEITTAFFHAWTVCDGKPRRCVVRSTQAEALEAISLME